MGKSLKDAVGGHTDHEVEYGDGWICWSPRAKRMVKDRSNKRIRREHRKIVRNALQELDQDIYDAQQYLADQMASDSVYDVYDEDFMIEPEPDPDDYEQDRDDYSYYDDDWGFDTYFADPPRGYSALPYSKRLLLQAYLETTYDKEDLVRMYLQKIDPDEIEELLEKAIELPTIDPVELPTLGDYRHA